MRWTTLLGGAAALTACGVMATVLAGPQPASAQGGGGERQQFQQLLLVPPDDKDYVVARIPEGFKAVVTDVVAYNVADGKGHRVPDTAQSYLWVGGYVEGKSAGLVNRLRLLGNQTEQWHMVTGFELRGAKELVVSSEKDAPGGSSALVYVTGYLTR